MVPSRSPAGSSAAPPAARCAPQRGPGGTGSPAAAQGEREAVLLDLIQELAGELGPGRRGPVGPDTSLQDELGIDSLGRLELLVRVQRAFGVRLDQERVLPVDTPRELQALIETAPAREPRVDLRPRRGCSPAERTAGASGPALPDAAASLPEVLRWHAARSPSRTHLTLLEGGRVRDLSYGRLLERARAVARALCVRGVTPGDAVALLLPTCEEFFTSFCGVLLAGAVPVPLPPPTRRDRAGECLRRQGAVLSDARATALITRRPVAEVAAGLGAEGPGPPHVLAAGELLGDRTGDDVGPGGITAESVGLLQYTSGSTGDPRGVVLTHGALLANVRAAGEVLRVTRDDVVVSWLPLHHDMGLVGAWLGSLYHGCRLVLLPPQAFLAAPECWLWAIHEHRGTLSSAPNFAYELCASRLDAGAVAGLDLSSWRVAMNGSEPVSAGTLERFRQRFAPHGLRPEALSPVYGLAENAVAVTLPRRPGPPRVDAIDRTAFQRDRVARPVASEAAGALRVVGCGEALPGHGVRVVAPDGEPVGERREGRVQFRGPSATRGYRGQPEANARLFAGDWLETGDLGYLAGGELFPTGRSKDVLFRAGRNVHPHELEQAIGRVEGVHRGRAAAFGVADEARGTERIVVVVETRRRDPVQRDELARRVQISVCPALNGFPDEVTLVRPGAIPRTSSGKLRRSRCRDLYLTGRLEGSRRLAGRPRLLLAAGADRLRRGPRSLAEATYAAYGLLLVLLSRWFSGCGVLGIPGLARRRRFVAGVCRLFLRLAGIRVEVEGREHLSAGPCLAVANHQGMLCDVVLSALLPDHFFFTPKREFSESRLADAFLRRLDFQYVDRRDPIRGVADLGAVEARLRAGESAVVHPEGTFRDEPGLRRFHMGAFVAAVATGTRVVPVAIRGARSIWRGKTWLPRLRRGSVTVRVLPPIAPAGGGWRAAVALRDECRRRILPHTGELDAGLQ